VHDLEGKADRAEGVGQFCARAPDGLIYAFPPDRDADVLAVIAAAGVRASASGDGSGNGLRAIRPEGQGRALAEHLVALGHHRIAILTRPRAPE